MPTFEIDARVRVNAPYYPLYVGREGVVIDIRNMGYAIAVEFDDGKLPTTGWFTPGELDAVETAQEV